MHGRLKVKTTAEQDEEKRIKREKKLKLFRKAVDSAFDKISNKVYDDKGLYITREILNNNSDYTTMWNYRKRTILHLKNEKSSEEFTSLMKDELSLVESCLRNNPKSYGCWNQREFVVLNMGDPDWKNELHLCDLFLQFDDRNFHCWDYRRFVVSRSDVTAEHELAFTNKLIASNFSNYSSWHYRSKLLPKCFPDHQNLGKIEEDKLLEELELVQNAFFTDPNDQSAWLYHRWLLGRSESKQSIISLSVCRNTCEVTCTFRNATNSSNCEDMCVTVNDVKQNGQWKNLTADKYAQLWVFHPNQRFTEGNIKVSIGGDNNATCQLSEEENVAVYTAPISHEAFNEASSASKLSVLEDELNSCQELNELEPGNKWVVLTLVLLMRSISSTKYSEEIGNLLQSLQKLDLKRKTYYQDLLSKYTVSDYLAECDLKSRKINLHGKGLTRICYTEYMTTITHLNIANNRLAKIPRTFHILKCLQELNAEENEISEVEGLENLQQLTHINLNKNTFKAVESLMWISSCPNLTCINLKGNPISEGLLKSDVLVKSQMCSLVLK